MKLKQRLLQGGALRSTHDFLVCGVEGEGGEGGEGAGAGGAGGEGADDAVKKLTAKVNELIGENRTKAEKLRAFEAEKAELAAKASADEEAAARQKGDFEKIEGNYKAKISALEGEGYLWKSRYEGLVIDRGMDEALDGAKVSPALKKAALALIKSEHPPEIDADGKATIDGKPIADFVAAWAKSDTGKAFVVNGNSGGGAGGGSGGAGAGAGNNPWKAGATYNLTEQGRLLKTNRPEAIRLAAEAGVKIA